MHHISDHPPEPKIFRKKRKQMAGVARLFLSSDYGCSNEVIFQFFCFFLIEFPLNLRNKIFFAKAFLVFWW